MNETSLTDNPANKDSIAVARKMLEVSRIVGRVEKNGINEAQRFKYQAWEDVLPAVRNACIQVGLLVSESCDSVERFTIAGKDKNGNPVDKQRLTVHCTFTFIDADNGKAIEASWYGESDAHDDKAIQKAITSATKYCYLKTFMIPVKGDIDPDGDYDSEPSQSKPPTSSKANPMTDYKTLTKKVLGKHEQKITELAKQHELNIVKIFAKVHESNGDKTTFAEFFEQFKDEVRQKGGEIIDELS